MRISSGGDCVASESRNIPLSRVFRGCQLLIAAVVMRTEEYAKQYDLSKGEATSCAATQVLLKD